MLWHKILLLLSACIIFLTVGIALTTWQSLNRASSAIGEDSKNILSQQTELFLEKLAEERAAGLDVQLSQARSAALYGAVFMSETPALYEPNNASTERLLSALYARTSHCSMAYYVSSSGLLLHYPAMHPEMALPQGFNMTREPFFPEPIDFRNRTEKVIWSQVHVNPLTVNFDLVIDAIAPVLVFGKVRGYIGVSVSLTRMIAQFNQYQPVRGSYSFLIDDRLQLLGAPPHARVELSSPAAFRSRGVIALANTDNSQLDMVLQKMVFGESSINKVTFKNEPKYLAHHPLKNVNWYLGIVVPVRMATAASGQLVQVVEKGIRQVLTGTSYWAGGFLILALFAGMMLARHVTAPIRRLSAATVDIARGDFKGKVQVASGDEMGILAAAFNKMADRIHDMIKDLNRANEDLNAKNEELEIEITERKRGEASIKLMNSILLTQQEASPDGMLVVDEQENIISHNKQFVHMWDISSEVIASKSDERARQSVLDMLAEPAEFLERIQYLYAHPGKKSLDEISLLDGRTIKRYSAPMTGSEGERYGRVWFFSDITEPKRREEKLRKSERRYRAVVEDMAAMICRFLPDGTLTFVNGAYCKYSGKKRDDLIGQNFFMFIPDKDKEKVKHHFLSLSKETPVKTREHQIVGPDGAVRWQEWTDRTLFDDKGYRVEYQSIGRDISEAKLAQEERKRMEKQLQQAQKMEAIGTLAGGIAHDFNNILAGIFGFSDLALNYVEMEDPVRHYLEQILQGGERARDLVQQILTFSRQTEQEKRPVRVAPLIKETVKLLRASLPATIEIKTEIDIQTDLILADPTQIHQILMNLCTNAGHAMRNTGGILGIRLIEMDLDPRSSLQYPDLREGPYLRLDVSDTGHGMPPEVVERIFDPYFTTKEKGEGTGLGLAVVHGIVKHHGGAVTVESDTEGFTTFHVLLPRVSMEPNPKPKAISDVPGGEESILFVDDEEMLVEFAQELLERLGYEVIAKTSSMEALETFRAHPEKFDVVITDQDMPNLAGVELARELLEIRPDIPIIMCTGFSYRINPEKAKALGFSAFLSKPVVARDLAQAIRSALDKAART